jgi:hypothetical protein
MDLSWSKGQRGGAEMFFFLSFHPFDPVNLSRFQAFNSLG